MPTEHDPNRPTKTVINSLTIVYDNNDRCIALDSPTYRITRSNDPDRPYTVRFFECDHALALTPDELIERFAAYDVEYLD